MCQELEKELAAGESASRLLAEHLERMGANKMKHIIILESGRIYKVEITQLPGIEMEAKRG